MTWMADAVSDSLSGRLETEVTSMSMSSSKLNFFSWATPLSAGTRAALVDGAGAVSPARQFTAASANNDAQSPPAQVRARWIRRPRFFAPSR